MLKTQPNPDAQNVTVMIPTFQRSIALKHVLRTFNAVIRTRHNVTILIVDNNPLPQERRFVENFRQQSAYKINYIHVPRPGLSNARNAGIEHSETRFIAFLDDDMEVGTDWVDGLVETALDHGTGLVFGPVHARFNNANDPRNAYLASLYSRLLEGGQKGEIQQTFGTGGCLIDLTKCEMLDVPFNPDLNQSGGEDDIFFDHLRQTGTKVGYAPRAISYELVPDDRVTPRYILRRNFGYGQGPTRIHASRGAKGAPGVIRHMLVGGVQFVLFGTAHIILKAIKHPASIKYLALAAQGVGKVFWTDRFRPKLYGASQINVKNTTR